MGSLHLYHVAPPRLALRALALLLLTRRAQPQAFGNGVGKNTYAATDPVRALAWLLHYLPVRKDDWSLVCEDMVYCPCGELGRVYFDDPGARSLEIGAFEAVRNAHVLKARPPCETPAL